MQGENQKHVVLLGTIPLSTIEKFLKLVTKPVVRFSEPFSTNSTILALRSWYVTEHDIFSLRGWKCRSSFQVAISMQYPSLDGREGFVWQDSSCINRRYLKREMNDYHSLRSQDIHFIDHRFIFVCASGYSFVPKTCVSFNCLLSAL